MQPNTVTHAGLDGMPDAQVERLARSPCSVSSAATSALLRLRTLDRFGQGILVAGQQTLQIGLDPAPGRARSRISPCPMTSASPAFNSQSGGRSSTRVSASTSRGW